MGYIKNRSINNLLRGLDEFEKGKKQSATNNSKTLKTLMEDYLNTPNKRQRERMTEEFKARRLEFAEFLKANPELVTIETKNALISAAVGGQYTDDEIAIDNKGKKSVKRSTKQVAPNVTAILKLLEMQDDGTDVEDDGFMTAMSEGVDKAWQKE